MQQIADTELLRQYAETGSEEAFRQLVDRHVNLVYSTALRRTGNPSLAEEITQAVFTIFARKASSLGRNIIVPGWLYHTTRLTAANAVRSEIRRVQREQEAYMQSLHHESEFQAWTQIAPLLETAMGSLNQKERDAVVLRFFQGRSMQEVGHAFGGSENAAKKRVQRALEKLRDYFASRKIVLTTALIAGAVSAHSVQAAPAGLAASVTAVAAQGAAGGSSTLTLIKGALKIMAWTKAKTAVITGVVVLLTAGATTVSVKQIKRHLDGEPWQVAYFNSRVLDRAAPEVKILPSKHPRGGGWGSGGAGWLGIGVQVKDLVTTAYQQSDARTILPDKLPTGHYDFISKLPKGSKYLDSTKALQQEIKRKFGLVGRYETMDRDVLLLSVKEPNSPGLVLSKKGKNESSTSWSMGHYTSQNQPLSSLAGNLESTIGVPVLDRSGLKGHFDIDLKWPQTVWQKTDPDALKQSLLDQLGLELVPSREPIEMLVVEKVK